MDIFSKFNSELEQLKVSDSLESNRLVEEMNAEFAALKKSFNKVEDYRAELLRINKIEDVGIGVWRGNKYFYTKRSGDAEWAKLYLEISGLERVVFDPEVFDSTGLTSIESWAVDPKGEKVILEYSRGGDEISTLIVIDTLTSELLDAKLEDIKYADVLWAKDGSGFWYTKHKFNDLDFDRRVYFHQIGEDYSQDKIVFGEGLDRNTYIGLDCNNERDLIIITTFVGCDPFNEVWIGAINPSGGEFEVKKVVEAESKASVELLVGSNNVAYFFNDHNASKGKVDRFSLEEILDKDKKFPGEAEEDFIDEDSSMVLEGVEIDEVANIMYLLYSQDTLMEIQMRNLATGEPLGKVPQPGVGAISEILVDVEKPGLLFFTFSNSYTVEQIYCYNVKEESTTLYIKPAGMFEFPEVDFKQISYWSRDGERVTANMTLPKSYTPGSPVPLIIYGYGGFSVSLEPDFNPGAALWANEGRIWVDAHLRGGAEQGEEWHEDGMLANKQNTFNDLYDLAEYLIEEGYTTAELLGIRGGSNGGLLVGTAVVQRPDLFKAAVSEAALLDMVEYPNTGLGGNWVSEYGDPKVTEELEWLLGYSPLHNIIEGVEYPATLIVNYQNDSRVDNMHGRRFAYLLKAAAKNPGEISLLTEMDAGHAGDNLSKSSELAATFLAYFDHHLKEKV